MNSGQQRIFCEILKLFLPRLVNQIHQLLNYLTLHSKKRKFFTAEHEKAPLPLSDPITVISKVVIYRLKSH